MNMIAGELPSSRYALRRDKSLAREQQQHLRLTSVFDASRAFG
jgi:hypothetical protein